MPVWADNSVFYHIYPIGFCGAEARNDFSSAPVNRLSKISKAIPHIRELGFNALYLGPVFESTAHGYDTADYACVDRRLGTNGQLKELCGQLHEEGVRIVLDGVFNHVGREFWAFRDVLEKREGSPYAGWFNINFSGNSNYNDHLWYEGWEGHYDLVKLNLANPEVRGYLTDIVSKWIDEFDIDGLRLDVAYLLSHDFIRELRSVCSSKKSGFWLMGETLHGDYNQYMKPDMLDSVTNYECYKGLFSSFNEQNLFEIGYSLHRQFGPEHWCIYKGKHLYTFVDNHDVSRIASRLNNLEHIPLIYALMYAMPGIPSVYYGSEWAVKGEKVDGDAALRPEFELLPKNDVTEYIGRLNKLYRDAPELSYGDYRQEIVQNKQILFWRCFEGGRVLFALNVGDEEFTAHFNANAGCGVDLITGEAVDFGGGLRVPPMTAMIIRPE